MSIENFKDLTESILNILVIFAGMIGGLWAYTVYIIERGILPAACLDIECKKLGSIGENAILDIGVHIKNTGSATLIAKNISLNVRYVKKNESQLDFYSGTNTLGRLLFPHSLKQDIETLFDQSIAGRIFLTKHDTFVQPGVDQRYGFTTRLDNDVACVLIHAEFEYSQKPKPIQNFFYKVSRSMGLINYSLQHVREPHTSERAFWVEGLSEN